MVTSTHHSGVTTESQKKNDGSTVYVVDDDNAMRRSIRELLHGIGYQVKSYSNGQAFMEGYVDRHPSCLVADLRLPDISGLQVIEKLSHENRWCPPVIIITGHGDISTASAAFKSGVIDYLEKPFPPQKLIELIEDAIRQDREAWQQREAKERFTEKLSSLTERERQVLEMLVKGLSSKETAFQLRLSEKTIGSHKARILEKFEVSNFIKLTRLYIEHN